MRLKLERFESSSQGTFGRLIFPDFSLFSGELPWKDNATSISCIPHGIYECKWSYSPRFKRYMYSVEAVSGRSGVRIHPANLMGSLSEGFKAQLNGCLSFGERLGTIDKQKALLLSRPAVRRFETYMNREPFTLEIINGYP